MDMTVDALGDKCPLPVVKAKKSLDVMGTGTLEVLVDNETAVTNLGNLAKKKNCTSTSEKLDDGTFRVLIVAGEDALCGENAASAAESVAAKPTVVVVASDVMGSGDDELGATLIKGFIFALTQQDVLPSAVLFYNGGVKLTCEGSPCIDDLQALVDAGVTVLSCGTCLGHYGLTEKLAVGEVTNMYVIVETQMNAGVILRP